MVRGFACLEDCTSAQLYLDPRNPRHPRFQLHLSTAERGACGCVSESGWDTLGHAGFRERLVPD